MAGFTLFPAETRVKLTLRQRTAMIAPMRSRVSRMAMCAAVALACNEGLHPTTCPGICGTVTYQGSLPDSLRDSTAAVLIVAFSTFPQTPADLLHFQPPVPAFVDTGGPPPRFVLPVPPRPYDSVVALWEKKSATSLGGGDAEFLLREVGFFRGGGDNPAPGTGRGDVRARGGGAIRFVI